MQYGSSGDSEMGKWKGESTDGAPGYERLDAFQVSDQVATMIYTEVRSLTGRDWWLFSQIVRAAASAPANIVEGYARNSNREFFQHLSIAHASLWEVDYFLRFMRNVGLATDDDISRLRPPVRRAARLVQGLMKAVKSDIDNPETQRRYIRDEREVYGDFNSA